jgi:hypothetical protein
MKCLIAVDEQSGRAYAVAAVHLADDATLAEVVRSAAVVGDALRVVEGPVEVVRPGGDSGDESGDERAP